MSIILCTSCQDGTTPTRVLGGSLLIPDYLQFFAGSDKLARAVRAGAMRLRHRLDLAPETARYKFPTSIDGP